MKRLTTILIMMCTGFAVTAQTNDHPEPLIDRGLMEEIVRTVSILLTIILFSAAILSIIRMILDNRIKKQMVEKGVSENIISQLLQPINKESSRDVNIKWFCILAGIGVGLALINFFQPLGIHSLAIMSFSLAASFLGYYYFTKRSEK
jgi:hypothetical protein